MPKAVWLLLIGMFVNVTGNSFLWPLYTIYIHDHLGRSLTEAGLVATLISAAGVVGNLLGGFLFDKIGGYRSIMGGIVLSAASLVLLCLFHSFYPFAAFTMILGFTGGIVFPSMYAMAGTVWPEGGRKAFNALYLSQNLGVAVGPALASFVADVNMEYIFPANLAFYTVFMLIASFSYKKLTINSNIHTSVLNEQKKIRQKAPFRAMLILTFGYMLSWVIYSQWSATISTHSLQLGVTLKQYSSLWTINGLLIVCGQPLIRPIMRRIESNMKAQLIIGILIFTLSFAVVAFAQQYTGFLVAMIILTLGEMFMWPAVPAIAAKLAPKTREGMYQGIVNSMASLGRMIGPVLGGTLADLYGVKVMIFLLMGLLTIAIATSLFYDVPLKVEQRRAKQDRPSLP